MEMEESVEGIGYVVESRPLFDPFPTFIVIRAFKLLLIALLFLLRAWAKKEYVDPKRIGIWGWVSLVLS